MCTGREAAELKELQDSVHKLIIPFLLISYALMKDPKIAE